MRDCQPGRGLVLRLGARQRRAGGVADRVRSRRPGTFGTADRGSADSDRVPQRAGGIAMADFTAGLLAAIAALAGLLGRGPERRAAASRSRCWGWPRRPGAAVRLGRVARPERGGAAVGDAVTSSPQSQRRGRRARALLPGVRRGGWVLRSRLPEQRQRAAARPCSESRILGWPTPRRLRPARRSASGG